MTDSSASISEIELRRRAEEIAAQKAAITPKALGEMPQEGLLKIVHELLVHQIELEMQNDELRRLKLELEVAHERYFDLYDLAQIGYCTLSDSGLIRQANLRAASLLGVSRSELIDQPVTSFIFKEDQDIYYLFRKQLTQGGTSNSRDLRMVRSDGAKFWAQLDATFLQIESGATEIRLILNDISERKNAEEKQQLTANVFAHTNEGIVITDANATLIDVNDSFTRITGFNREDVLGQNARILKSDRNDRQFFVTMWQQILRTGTWSGEIWNRHKNGEIYPVLLTINAVYDSTLRVQSYVGLLTDISRIKRKEQQLLHMAHFDVLTNLPNRALLSDRMQQAIAQSQRHKLSMAVAYLDLDGFKMVNDQHGHDVGDELLIAITQRLKTALREVDTLARIGGDEFVVVLVDLNTPQDSEPVLERLLRMASDPLVVGESVIQVSVSIGVSIYPLDGEDADQLLRFADHAMYQAKLAGKNCYRLFNKD